MQATALGEQPVRTFLDDGPRFEQFQIALAEVTPELQRFENELDQCERLTERDLDIRINARG